MERCCICQRNIEREDAPVLTMGAAGIPRLLCSECEELLDTATSGNEISEIEEAIDEISNRVSHGNPDGATCKVLEELMGSASQRAAAIKSGNYDFSLDGAGDDINFDEIPDELLESEEDIQKDREDEIKMERFNKIYNIIILVTFLAVGAYVAYRIIDTFFLK